jgi:hypothetical protein
MELNAEQFRAEKEAVASIMREVDRQSREARRKKTKKLIANVAGFSVIVIILVLVAWVTMPSPGTEGWHKMTLGKAEPCRAYDYSSEQFDNCISERAGPFIALDYYEDTTIQLYTYKMPDVLSDEWKQYLQQKENQAQVNYKGEPGQSAREVCNRLRGIRMHVIDALEVARIYGVPKSSDWAKCVVNAMSPVHAR